MKSFARAALSVGVGLVTAFVMLIAVEGFSAVVHPFPEGFRHTPEEMCRHVANYPPWVLAAVVPMWGATALICVWMTGKIGSLSSALIVGTLLLAAVVANVAMLPYPSWFSIACPLVVVLAIVAAARPMLGRKSVKSG